MRKLATVSLVALAALTAPASARLTERSPRQVPEYRITDVRAHLFYHDRGSLSDNILARPELGLDNGQDFVNGGSFSAALIVVEVTGPPGSYPDRRVELAARTRTGRVREIFRQQVRLDVLNSDGRGYAAFLLHNTGCAPIDVSTALLGQRDTSRRVTELLFHCGE